MLTYSDYIRHDALGLAELVQRGETTAAELLETAIARTEAVNPKINAVVVKRFDEARASAAQMSQQAAAEAGPFGGVPFLVKDLLSPLADATFSNGARALRDYRPKHDAEIMRRCKAAGLQIFGKTNTPEFGLVPFTEPLLHGPCRNPWHCEHTPGGSSGGAGAVVAAGIVPMAHGGDGGGSIRIPASHCGLFGLKPSRGRTPSGPDNAEPWSGAVVEHVLTRSVRDSAAMLDLLAPPDVGAPYIIPRPAEGFLAATRTPPPRLTIGLITEAPDGAVLAPECRAAVEHAGKLLTDLGHHVEPIKPFYTLDELAAWFLPVYFGEIAAGLRELSHVLGRPLRRDDVELETRVLGRLGELQSSGAWVAARHRWNELARRTGALMERYPILVSPVLADPPPKIGGLKPKAWEHAVLTVFDALGLHRLLAVTGTLHKEARRGLAHIPFTLHANLTGLPSMSVPLHQTAAGLPVGVQFTGRFAEEALMLSLAAELERAAPWFDQLPALQA